MNIFETERLVIKRLEIKDLDNFTELFSDERVLAPIPQKAFTESQIAERFNTSLNLKLSDLENSKRACGIFEKENPELIGLALFLINPKNEKELGYRFRVNYWGKGYGTEVTIGMLNYYFNEMNVDIVTADVNTENIASVKILNKFMKPVKEFFNERDHCRDRQYEITKRNWLKQKS